MDKTVKEGDKVFFEKLGNIPKEPLKTLTRDNGAENKHYENVEKAFGIKVYFANLYSSYERGTNENANGLLRRFLQKEWIGKRLVGVFYKKTGVNIYEGVAINVLNIGFSLLRFS